MDAMINGKTPEVIKSNLSYLVRCETCQQNHEYGCDYDMFVKVEREEETSRGGK